MNDQEIISRNDVDDHGRPAGGYAFSTGLTVIWQNGPLGRHGSDERVNPNGAFVETLLRVARDRIDFYNNAGFGCAENYSALAYIDTALDCLAARTARRIEQNVEGTHEGN